jgi:hypothetical protein
VRRPAGSTWGTLVRTTFSDAGSAGAASRDWAGEVEGRDHMQAVAVVFSTHQPSRRLLRRRTATPDGTAACLPYGEKSTTFILRIIKDLKYKFREIGSDFKHPKRTNQIFLIDSNNFQLADL